MGTARGAHDLASSIIQWSITVVGKMDDTTTFWRRPSVTKTRQRGRDRPDSSNVTAHPTFPPTCARPLESIPLTRSDASHIWIRTRAAFRHSVWQGQCILIDNTRTNAKKESNKLYPPVLMIAPPVRDAASPAARKRICGDTNAWRLKDERLVVVQFSVTDSKSLSTPASWGVPRNMINRTPDDVGRTNESKVVWIKSRARQEEWQRLRKPPTDLTFFFKKKKRKLK